MTETQVTLAPSEIESTNDAFEALPSFDSGTYRSVFRAHPAGVAVITVNGPNGPTGFTATSVVSVSADPGIVLFTIMESSSNWAAVSAADTVVIHFLASEQAELSQRFATSGIDRFAGVEWSPLDRGEPLIAGIDTWMRCAVLSRDRAGGSFVVLAEPLEGRANGERTPLVYYDRQYHRLTDESVISA